MNATQTKMAFSSGTKRKEVKKSSYYVWFLGAKESRGLRGEEYVWPAVHYLTERENDVEPIKVTLQVSSKGLKIIQNVSRANGGSKAVKSEMSKHFIPDHSITCVLQDSKPNDDVVAAILLIFNPVSKCPVHVHAYRCDSVETATVLRQHLQVLVERPENQRKFLELERRLQAKGLLPPPPSCAAAPTRLNSDGRSIRTESDSSGGGSDRDIYALDERMSSLYDSLAAELREKLNNKKNNGPLLLPPRDYDTVHRMRGNLDDIEQRRSQMKIVAGNGTGQSKRTNEPGHSPAGYVGELDSSGKSSGIGSDEAPSSPTHERNSHSEYRNAPPPPAAAPKKKNLHDESSSEEEWERQQQKGHRGFPGVTDEEMGLVQSPRSSRVPNTGLRPRDHGRRSPSPPSSMHPPSPKPPPYRERYYEGERTNGSNGHHQPSDRKGGISSRNGPAGYYPDRNGDSREYAMQQAKSRPATTRAVDDYDHPRERPLRRVKSRDDKDYMPCSKRDTGYRSRSDREPFTSRDLADRSPPTTVPHIPHPQLSHSRSYDLLSSPAEEMPPRRENGRHYRLRDNSDQWTAASYGERDRCAKSPPLTSSPSKPLPPECNGYVPLPRIRRVDSGHSSGNTHHSSGHHQPTTTTPSYQELPDEKRYPGLDRETARPHHHQYAPSGGHSKMRDYDHRAESGHVWDSRERECPRYDYPQVMQKMERSSSGHNGSATRASTMPYCNSAHSPEHPRQDKMAVPSASQGAPKHLTANSSTDDKRFYRYSSSDPDCRYSGRKMASAGYHY